MSGTKAIITLENGVATVESVNGQVRSKKEIAVESLSQIIEQQTAMRTPILPGDWGTKLFARKANREYYMLTTPPGRMNVRFNHRGRFDPDDETLNFRNQGEMSEFEITRPALAWFVCVEVVSGERRKIRGETYVFALKHQVLGLNDEMYRAPFNNVYGDNRICWSGNLNTALPTPAALVSIQSQFFSAAFNSDLDDGRFRPFNSDLPNIIHGGRVRHGMELFHHLHTDLIANPETARFPETALVKADKRIGDYFNRFVESS